jgi:hypothetical protein
MFFNFPIFNYRKEVKKTTLTDLPIELLTEIFILAQNPKLKHTSRAFHKISLANWTKKQWILCSCKSAFPTFTITSELFYEHASLANLCSTDFLVYLNENTKWRCTKLPEAIFTTFNWGELSEFEKFIETLDSRSRDAFQVTEHHIALSLSSPKLAPRTFREPLGQTDNELVTMLASYPWAVSNKSLKIAIRQSLDNLIPHIVSITPQCVLNSDIKELIQLEKVEIIEYLVDNTAVTVVNGDLKFAMEKGWIELAIKFIERGAVIWHEDFSTALEFGHIDLIRAFLQRREIAVWNDDLKYLLKNERWDLLQLVLEKENNAFIYNEDLTWCLRHAPAEVNQKLLARPDVTIYYDDMTWILEHGNKNMIAQVLERPDTAIFTDNIRWAVEHRRKSILELFVKNRKMDLSYVRRRSRRESITGGWRGELQEIVEAFSPTQECL